MQIPHILVKLRTNVAHAVFNNLLKEFFFFGRGAEQTGCSMQLATEGRV